MNNPQPITQEQSGFWFRAIRFTRAEYDRCRDQLARYDYTSIDAADGSITIRADLYFMDGTECHFVAPVKEGPLPPICAAARAVIDGDDPWCRPYHPSVYRWEDTDQHEDLPRVAGLTQRGYASCILPDWGGHPGEHPMEYTFKASAVRVSPIGPIYTRGR